MGNTPSSGHISLIGVVAVILLAYISLTKLSLYLARRRFKIEHGCKPPQRRYPLKDPIFGLDLMRENLSNAKNLRFLEGVYLRFQRMEAYTYTARLLRIPLIITIEPENVKTILSLKFKDYMLGNRQDTLGPLLGKGIFTTDGEPWAESRHMIRPNFARDQVADLAAFERHIKQLFKAIPRDRSSVDLQELFFRFTIDSATEFLFGHSVNSLKSYQERNSAEASFAAAFNFAQHEIALETRISFLKYLRRSKKATEAIHLCHEFVDQFVNDAVRYRQSHDLEKHVKDERYVFLYELAKATDDKRRIRDELLNVLLAGRDTTASLLSNMFFMIAKRPNIWAKLQAEIAQLDGKLPTYEQLRNLKYLKYCLNESLRVHPVVPGNSRTAVRDTVLPLGGGPDGKSPLFVKEGTIVAYSPWSMHRRKDFFGEDSQEFKPERWENLRPGWEYLPFNGGPRICLGQQYALTEASYVTVRILQEFKKIESRDEGPWQESLALTLCSHNGVKVALTPA